MGRFAVLLRLFVLLSLSCFVIANSTDPNHATVGNLVSEAADSVVSLASPETSLVVADVKNDDVPNTMSLYLHVFTDVIPGIIKDFCWSYLRPFFVCFCIRTVCVTGGLYSDGLNYTHWLAFSLLMPFLALMRYIFGECIAFLLSWLPALLYDDMSYLPDTRVLGIDILAPLVFSCTLSPHELFERKSIHMGFVILTVFQTSIPFLRQASILLYSAAGVYVYYITGWNIRAIPLALTCFLYATCAAINPGKGHLEFPETAYQRFKPYDTPSLWKTINDVSIDHFVNSTLISFVKTILIPGFTIFLLAYFVIRGLVDPSHSNSNAISLLASLLFSIAYIFMIFIHFIFNDVMKFLARRNFPFTLFDNGSFLLNPELFFFRAEFYCIVLSLLQLFFFKRSGIISGCLVVAKKPFDRAILFVKDLFVRVTTVLLGPDLFETSVGSLLEYIEETREDFAYEHGEDFTEIRDHHGTFYASMQLSLGFVLILYMDLGLLFMVPKYLAKFLIIAQAATVALTFLMVNVLKSHLLELVPYQALIACYHVILWIIIGSDNGAVSWCYHLYETAGIQRLVKGPEDESAPQEVLVDSEVEKDDTDSKIEQELASLSTADDVALGTSALARGPEVEAIEKELLDAHDMAAKGLEAVSADCLASSLSLALFASILLLC